MSHEDGRWIETYSACCVFRAGEDGDFVLVEGASTGIAFRSPPSVGIHFSEAKQFRRSQDDDDDDDEG